MQGSSDVRNQTCTHGQLSAPIGLLALALVAFATACSSRASSGELPADDVATDDPDASDGSAEVETDFGNYRPQIQGELADISGGRGGEVVRVTSLEDDGSPGTLRWAVTQSNAVVVFEVSGYIELTDELGITGHDLTIAGQTAPPPGITLKNYGVAVGDYGRASGAVNVVIQHIAIRPGWNGSNCNSGAIVYANRVLFDHVSMSWQQDEGISPFVVDDTVIWRSLIAEALWGSEEQEVCGGGGSDIGHGLLVYSRSHHIQIAQNVFASNASRNPLLVGDTDTILVNNLVYNWKAPWSVAFQNQISGQVGDQVTDAWFASVVGNRFIPNAGIQAFGGTPGGTVSLFFFDGDTGDGGGADELYDSDNTIEANPYSEPFERDLSELSYDPRVAAPPARAPLSNFDIIASTDVEAHLIANAGARPAARDEVDGRVIGYIQSRGLPRDDRPYLFDEEEIGGFPVLASQIRPWTDAADPDAVAEGQAFRTNREMKLEAEARALEP